MFSKYWLMLATGVMNGVTSFLYSYMYFKRKTDKDPELMMYSIHYSLLGLLYMILSRGVLKTEPVNAN